MKPTLYVPKPMEGWEVPSRRGMEGHWIDMLSDEDVVALDVINLDDGTKVPPRLFAGGNKEEDAADEDEREFTNAVAPTGESLGR